MADKIQCDAHGEAWQTFVCSHIPGQTTGLGFNRNEPDSDNPYPDAWCDDCELIRSAHGGWNEESEKLIKLALLCSGCYQQALIRNTRTAVTFDDLTSLRWKCHSCEEWHTGPCLDFTFSAPDYWRDEYEESSRNAIRLSDWSLRTYKSYLTEDYCVIENEHFFVRGLIEIPIIGTVENLRWCVWGSLSRQNYEALLDNEEKPGAVRLPPMFSWLSSRIVEYPDTLNLKMYARIQPSGERLHFELEAGDHPLSLEFHNGIAPERVKEIMKERLRESE